MSPGRGGTGSDPLCWARLLPRVHLVRYGGCLAPHSLRRGAITPTLRQRGVEEPEASRAALELGAAAEAGVCSGYGYLPSCHRGALRLIAVMTQKGEVIRTILRHLKLAADPPPLAPARARQATFDWVA